VAIGDLLSKLGGDSDTDELDVPDDLSALDDDPDAEPDDALPADPAPRRRRAGARPAVAGKATAADRRKVKDALTLMFRVVAGGVAMRDPVCGGAAVEACDATVAAVVPIICRNPGMLAWFTASNAPFMDILALLVALQPVVTTVWAHHVTHTIGPGHPAAAGGEPVDLSAYTSGPA
jgi:hypothetical protein